MVRAKPQPAGATNPVSAGDNGTRSSRATDRPPNRLPVAQPAVGTISDMRRLVNSTVARNHQKIQSKYASG